MALAPAAFGCAAGVLLSDNMGKGVRRAAAFALFSVGVAAAAPFVVDYLSKRVNGPTTARGQRRTRQLIRDTAVPIEAEFYGLEALEAVEL